MKGCLFFPFFFMSEKFYLSTSIAYVNAKPHIGYTMELLQGDTVCRYEKLRGKEVFYLTGTDEHGSKIAQVAKESGIEPKQLVDENAALFRKLTVDLKLINNGFVRTTDEAHKRGAQKIWKKMFNAGDLYKDSYEGLYCVGCEAFILEKDLVDGLCPNHMKPPEKLKEENYFFKLSKYNDAIQQLIETDVLKIVPQSRKREILEVIKDGLRDVSFSRPKKVLTWGIDVPNDPDQVMYVWCDALSNYITALGYEEESELFQKFWPAEVHLIGKDILRFHSAIWIGMLMSAGLALPKAIYVHGYITAEGKKMSKSLNNVVDPYEYIEKYGVDPLRYFLLKEIPTTDDGDFSKERFQVLYAELSNNIGNLVSRVCAMTEKYFAGKVPEVVLNNEILAPIVETTWKDYDQAMADFDLRKALDLIGELAMVANKYVEDKKPWALAKTDENELKNVMYDLLEMIRHIAVLLQPFVPETAQKILRSLGFAEGEILFDGAKNWGGLPVGQMVTKGEILFEKVE